MLSENPVGKPIFESSNFLMKKIISVLFVFVLVACARPVIVNKNVKPLPPGQAKKLTGSQSAKPYAPGQQKKTVAPVQQKSTSGQKSSPGQQKKKN
jgi:hypothetical protein